MTCRLSHCGRRPPRDLRRSCQTPSILGQQCPNYGTLEGANKFNKLTSPRGSFLTCIAVTVLFLLSLHGLKATDCPKWRCSTAFQASPQCPYTSPGKPR